MESYNQIKNVEIKYHATIFDYYKSLNLMETMSFEKILGIFVRYRKDVFDLISESDDPIILEQNDIIGFLNNFQVYLKGTIFNRENTQNLMKNMEFYQFMINKDFNIVFKKFIGIFCSRTNFIPSIEFIKQNQLYSLAKYFPNLLLNNDMMTFASKVADSELIERCIMNRNVPTFDNFIFVFEYVIFTMEYQMYCIHHRCWEKIILFEYFTQIFKLLADYNINTTNKLIYKFLSVGLVNNYEKKHPKIVLKHTNDIMYSYFQMFYEIADYIRINKLATDMEYTNNFENLLNSKKTPIKKTKKATIKELELMYLNNSLKDILNFEKLHKINPNLFCFQNSLTNDDLDVFYHVNNYHKYVPTCMAILTIHDEFRRNFLFGKIYPELMNVDEHI